METIERTIEIFLELEKRNGGQKTIFSIDFKNEQILVVDMTSAQLKRMYENDKVVASLHNGVITVQYFN
jgi:hypothetical protein